MSRGEGLLGEGLRFRLRELARALWVRVVLFSAAGVILALLSARIAPYLPVRPSIDLASGAVDDLLNILATSMLAVTTFSISIAVTAYGGATSNATPRATALLASDSVAQSAMAIFMGSFIFSIVGIVGLSAGAYDGSGRVILFFATLVVIILITWAMIRWIDHLNEFGRVSDIIRRIEEAATESAVGAGAKPALGAQPGPAPGVGPESPRLCATATGYLRHVDVTALEQIANEAGLHVQLDRIVGDFVAEGAGLARLSRPVAPEVIERLQAAFSLGTRRSFDQDMGYGLVVLSEVASRALSPAVNDPGTAVEVLRAGTRVLLAFHAARQAAEPAGCHRLHAPDIDIAEAYRMFFAPIARDGAGVLEVQLVLQDALAALAEAAGQTPARDEAREALSCALDALTRERERRLLAAAVTRHWPGLTPPGARAEDC